MHSIDHSLSSCLWATEYQLSHSLRFALTVLNMTNHFNALDVHANTGDPQYGVFFGNYQRKFRGDFDVIF